jgi:cytochrome c oxidase subunit II
VSRRNHGYNARALRPAPLLNRRAGAAVAVLVAIVASLVAAPAAFAGIIAPENNGGSPNAEHIHTLYLIVFFMGLAVFLLVEGLLIYSLIKFRFRRGGPAPAQIRGNTPLEIGWTVGAAAILVVLTVITFIFLDPIKNPAGSRPNGLVAEQRQSQKTQFASAHTPTGDGAVQFATLNQPAPPGPPRTHLTVHVNGQQYIWRFDYPGFQAGGAGVFSYHDMYVPTNTTVTLDITSSDVAHSWWIPPLGGKADAIPSYTNHTWFRISKAGVYEGQCAEFCGENHADMRARVIAVPPATFRRWEAKQAADLKESQALLALTRRQRGTGTGP